MSKLRVLESSMIIVFALVTALSGYFYAEIDGTSIVLDRPMRGMVIVSLLLSVSLSFLRFREVKVPWAIVPLVIFVLYTASVSLSVNGVNEFISPFLRWMICLVVCVYFYNLEDPQPTIKKLIVAMAFAYFFSIMYDLYSFRMVNANGAYRMFGSVCSFTGFASALFVVQIWLLYLYLKRNNLFYFSLSVVCYIGVVFSGTRAVAILGLACYFLYYAAVDYQRLKSARRLALSISLLLVSLFALLSYTSIGGRSKMISTDNVAVTATQALMQGGDSSVGFRSYLVSVVLENMDALDYVFGVGLGGFAGWFSEHTGRQGVAPHMEVVWLVVEGGVVGSALYIFAFLYVAYHVFREKQFLKSDFEICLVGLLLFFSQQTLFQFANPTYFYQVMIPIYAALGIMLRGTTNVYTINNRLLLRRIHA